MRNFVLALAALSVPALAAPAIAQDADRFRLEKTEDGYVRMDTETGEMSICEERAGQLVCRLAADERSAFQDEIDRLSGSVKALEDRVTALEKAPAVPGLPTEEEFDKTMSYMQRFFRGFMDIVKDLENDKEPPATQQKT
jgi:hypothetical protein